VRSPEIERARSEGRWGWRGESTCVRSPVIERSMVARGVTQDAQAVAVARLEWEQLVQVHMVRKVLILDRCGCGTTARTQASASPIWCHSGLHACAAEWVRAWMVTDRELVPRQPESRSPREPGRAVRLDEMKSDMRWNRYPNHRHEESGADPR
jgi:hypothetical protein